MICQPILKSPSPSLKEICQQNYQLQYSTTEDNLNVFNEMKINLGIK
jgi:hypothetical protein